MAVVDADPADAALDGDRADADRASGDEDDVPRLQQDADRAGGERGEDRAPGVERRRGGSEARNASAC
ncbi:hypothetical protein C241_14848 [Bradyrhizobium lupini HPC(L)]|uniref:Uncharacterized protein n=1 Tax=Bradyrhizobium lupini HPC(L) TaxID=1229491 RepID=A0ABN0HKQ3_RHILU|nr:hypothetical protein C241_14848 [Bradyrhizobium lupini HPC(L)]